MTSSVAELKSKTRKSDAYFNVNSNFAYVYIKTTKATEIKR